MDNVVPGALRHLCEADIMSMAGLELAALGQEYYRLGAVHSTMRQEVQLTGIVEVPGLAFEKAASPTNAVEEVQETGHVEPEPGRYLVKVEIHGRSTWSATCSCNVPSDSFSICPHAAALLYQWLAHPLSFIPPSSDSNFTEMPPSQQQAALQNGDQEREVLPESMIERYASQAEQTIEPPGSPPGGQVTVPLGNLTEMLIQLGLSELRAIAREYDVIKTGLSKQQLVETIVELLKQPEVVRRVVGSLEKQQRQLLAAITLAGGAVTDDELRGLFERFSLGYPNQLQGALAALRSKCLLLRTSFNASLQQRMSLVGSLLEVGWYVPSEVRAALHVTVPVTPFEVRPGKDGEAGTTKIEQARPYALLEDLLLVARALDGYQLGKEDEEGDRSANRGELRGHLIGSPTVSSSRVVTLPPPPGMPSPALLASLQAAVPRSPAFLHFAIRLLRLVDILYKDDAEAPYLRALPTIARLLLGPTRKEVARDLFKRWLTQPTYAELFDLQEEGLHLRFRTGPLGRPALRTGELETENGEARQVLVALLAKVPLNQWISFSAFARFVYRLNPTFLQRRQSIFSLPTWWLEREEGRPLHPAQLNDWMRVEGRYLNRLLCGPFHWWGLSDLALSSTGQLLAFRLTPLTGLLLNGTIGSRHVIKEDDQAPAAVLKISQTGDILISCSSSAWPLIESIEDFAEVAGVQSEWLRYRLTARSLGDAFSRGLHPSDLLQVLRQHASAGEPLTSMLERLEQRIASYGRLRLYTDVTLLEVSDTPVMRELAATTPLEEQVVRAIHPTALILKKQGAERIVQDLKRRGQTPLLHEEESFLASEWEQSAAHAASFAPNNSERRYGAE
jgi:Helicase conserved C-terminal domain